jgi:succinoglycan biosynthesis protein ExoA
VVDGGSTDGTRKIVEGLAAANPNIRILTNEKRIQSAAVNMAARQADPRSTYILRADCHARYPDGFVERCIRQLVSERVASIVVPLRTEGTTCLQRAIAEAQNSRLGNGGSAHRVPAPTSGFVDHGHHAAFDRVTFLELGGYDENFTHNEDAELDRRLVQAGKRIYLASDATVIYYPRASLAALARQYFRHGAGRASTILKHRSRPRLRQLLPVVMLLACSASLALSIVEPRFLAIPGVYIAASTLWALGLAIRQRDKCLVLTGLATIVMHMSWGSGFLNTLLKVLLRRD